MTSALSRTALVPNYNVTPASWDHTWNEFFDPISERWVAWEPVNYWFDHAYGAPFANYGTRGDAGVFHVTDQYEENIGVLQVRVEDADGLPVDGATVTLWSPYDEYWWYAGEAGTGPDGLVEIPVTADKQLAMRVQFGDVSHPPEDNRITGATEGIAAGTTEPVVVSLDTSAAVSPEREATMDAGEPKVSLAIDGAVRGARTMHASYRYGGHSAMQETTTAAPTWFLTDIDNYLLFRDGEPHGILVEGTLGDGAVVDLDPAVRWVWVLVNEADASTTVFPELTLSMTPGSAGTWQGEVTHAEAPMLRAGEHVSVLIHP
jgi:hypothetical protein